jgi:diacylglycerol kinase (ATP)
MPGERISILYNPSAGMGRALKRKLKLEHLLKHFEVRYDLIMTRSEDHLKALVREHAKTYKTLVGAGGDSTFHIMVNELIAASADVDFGMIGVGSSNDMTMEFGVDTLEKACRALKNPGVRKIDLGCISAEKTPLRYFVGQANIGLGAFVNKRVAELAVLKPWLAKRQTLAGILGIRKAYRSRNIPLPLIIESEAGRAEGEFTAAIFSNIKFWATGKIINPSAVPDDGKLEACLIKNCSFLRLARISRLANKGKHVEAGEVEIHRAPCFEVSSEKPFEIQSDGEMVKTPEGRTTFHRITFCVVPRALNLICPQSMPL